MYPPFLQSNEKSSKTFKRALDFRCSAPERRITFPEGKLIKETMSAEHRRDQLQKKIEKQQAELKKLEVDGIKMLEEFTAAINIRSTYFGKSLPQRLHMLQISHK